MSYNGLLNQSATLYNGSSVDEYGRDSYAAGTTVKCRFEEVDKSRLLPNGEIKQIDGIVFVQGDATVNIGDKITYSSVNYRVVSKNVVVARATTHHIELEVQRWI